MFGRTDIDTRELDALSKEEEFDDLDENDLALLDADDPDDDEEDDDMPPDFDDDDFDDDEDEEDDE